MITRINRLTLLTANLAACLKFYTGLGFEVTEKRGRYELAAKTFRISVEVLGRQIPPHAANIQCGTLEFCLAVDVPLESLAEELAAKNIHPEKKIARTAGRMIFRDPDGNMIEFVSALRK